MNWTDPIRVVIEKNYEIMGPDFVIDYMLPVTAIAISGVFAGLIYSQIKSQEKAIQLQNESVQKQNESIKIQHKELKLHERQLQYQRDLEAFKTIREFRMALKANSDHKSIINIINKIVRHKEPQNYDVYDDSKLRAFLSEFETLALQWKDGMIKIEYIDELLGRILLNMREIRLKGILYETHKQNPNAYTNLIKLMKKIKDRRKLNMEL